MTASKKKFTTHLRSCILVESRDKLAGYMSDKTKIRGEAKGRVSSAYVLNAFDDNVFDIMVR